MTSDTHISSSEMSRIAIQIAIAGIFLFAALDAAMKGLSLEVGVFTTLFARVLIGTLLSAVLYFFKWKGKPTIKAIKLHALRAILSAFIANILKDLIKDIVKLFFVRIVIIIIKN